MKIIVFGSLKKS